MIKYLIKQQRRSKILFLLMVSEVSVHCMRGCSFSVKAEAECHSGGGMWQRLIIGCKKEKGKKREREKDRERGRKGEGERGNRDNKKRSGIETPKHLLPVRFHLLICSEPPQMVLLSGDQLPGTRTFLWEQNLCKLHSDIKVMSASVSDATGDRYWHWAIPQDYGSIRKEVSRKGSSSLLVRKSHLQDVFCLYLSHQLTEHQSGCSLVKGWLTQAMVSELEMGSHCWQQRPLRWVGGAEPF